MTVIFIAKRHGSKNNACGRTYDGYLVAEFVFLMFLALADALHLRLMDGIYLFPAVAPLGKNGFKKSEQSVIVVIPFKIAPPDFVTIKILILYILINNVL